MSSTPQLQITIMKSNNFKPDFNDENINNEFESFLGKDILENTFNVFDVFYLPNNQVKTETYVIDLNNSTSTDNASHRDSEVSVQFNDQSFQMSTIENRPDDIKLREMYEKQLKYYLDKDKSTGTHLISKKYKDENSNLEICRSALLSIFETNGIQYVHPIIEHPTIENGIRKIIETLIVGIMKDFVKNKNKLGQYFSTLLKPIPSGIFVSKQPVRKHNEFMSHVIKEIIHLCFNKVFLVASIYLNNLSQHEDLSKFYYLFDQEPFVSSFHESFYEEIIYTRKHLYKILHDNIPKITTNKTAYMFVDSFFHARGILHKSLVLKYASDVDYNLNEPYFPSHDNEMKQTLNYENFNASYVLFLKILLNDIILNEHSSEMLNQCISENNIPLQHIIHAFIYSLQDNTNTRTDAKQISASMFYNFRFSTNNAPVENNNKTQLDEISHLTTNAYKRKVYIVMNNSGIEYNINIVKELNNIKNYAQLLQYDSIESLSINIDIYKLKPSYVPLNFIVCFFHYMKNQCHLTPSIQTLFAFSHIDQTINYSIKTIYVRGENKYMIMIDNHLDPERLKQLDSDVICNIMPFHIETKLLEENSLYRNTYNALLNIDVGHVHYHRIQQISTNSTNTIDIPGIDIPKVITSGHNRILNLCDYIITRNEPYHLLNFLLIEQLLNLNVEPIFISTEPHTFRLINKYSLFFVMNLIMKISQGSFSTEPSPSREEYEYGIQSIENSIKNSEEIRKFLDKLNNLNNNYGIDDNTLLSELAVSTIQNAFGEINTTAGVEESKAGGTQNPIHDDEQERTSSQTSNMTNTLRVNHKYIFEKIYVYLLQCVLYTYETLLLKNAPPPSLREFIETIQETNNVENPIIDKNMRNKIENMFKSIDLNSSNDKLYNECSVLLVPNSNLYGYENLVLNVNNILKYKERNNNKLTIPCFSISEIEKRQDVDKTFPVNLHKYSQHIVIKKNYKNLIDFVSGTSFSFSILVMNKYKNKRLTHETMISDPQNLLMGHVCVVRRDNISLVNNTLTLRKYMDVIYKHSDKDKGLYTLPDTYKEEEIFEIDDKKHDTYLIDMKDQYSDHLNTICLFGFMIDEYGKKYIRQNNLIDHILNEGLDDPSFYNFKI